MYPKFCYLIILIVFELQCLETVVALYFIDLFHMVWSYSRYYGNCYVGRQRNYNANHSCGFWLSHNHQTRGIKQSFYRIPRGSDCQRQWLAFIGRRNKDGLPWEPGTGDRVCSGHFLLKKNRISLLIWTTYLWSGVYKMFHV